MGDLSLSTANLASMTDEEALYKLLDATENFDERKKVRARLREVQAEGRAKRDEMMKRREEEREAAIRQRQKEAEEQKKRTLAMYDQMAKSAPAGGPKVMDMNIYKDADGSAPVVQTAPKRDLVEEAIQQRHREAEERKRKILAAYDASAKSGPAGPKSVDFNLGKDDGQAKPAPAPTNNQKMSARDKFQQIDAQSAKQQGGRAPRAGIVRSASDIKDMLLQWCRSKTKEYENVEIQNFSTSWNDGMAFCALIHHFYPDSFDFNTLNPKNRRHNFTLAFKVAEDHGGIAPLLDVEDMVIMKKPDWKCVFTYVQSLYRKLYNAE